MNHPVRTLHIPTRHRSQMVEMTDEVQRACNIADGYVVVYVPHTTAGTTIQENADPDVQRDLLRKLDELVPKREAYYQHGEGNSDSHLKTSMVGNSVTVLVEDGKLLLGQWQGIYLCEFDGPRRREVWVKSVETK